jgi:hypothetical protein
MDWSFTATVVPAGQATGRIQRDGAVPLASYAPSAHRTLVLRRTDGSGGRGMLATWLRNLAYRRSIGQTHSSRNHLVTLQYAVLSRIGLYTSMVLQQRDACSMLVGGGL